jgi:glycerophosphoryl diester phosphodiesterase
VELIAHRAGNEAHLIAPAAEAADAIELDVHLFRGRLEVRHSKVLWPLAVYWERWELLPDESPVDLAAILDAAPEGVHLWFDLKGFTTRLARRVLREVGGRRPITCSTRSWWTLRPIRRAGGIRTFRSVGSRRQLWLIQRMRFAGEDDGVVMHERFATADVVARLRRRTSQVIVWAVDDLERARELARVGVTGIIADDLALLVAIRRDS